MLGDQGFIVLMIDFGIGVDAHDHLLSSQERVADELACAQGHLAFRHLCCMISGWWVVELE